MKFCSSCGASVNDNDKFCHVCGALLTDGEKAQQSETPANACSQPAAGDQTQSRPSDHIDYFDIPTKNVYANNVERILAESKPVLPVNKIGIVGFVFSLLSLILIISMFIAAVGFVASNPDFVNDPNYYMRNEEFLAFAVGIFLCMLFAGLFAIVGVSISGVGVARKKRTRLYGFAIAGLVISCVVLFVCFVVYASATA